MPDKKPQTLSEVELFERYVEFSPMCRLYYKTREKGNGFDFKCVFITAFTETAFAPESEVEIIAHGIALFDGVRHLYFGDDWTGCTGYLYYPDLQLLSRLLATLNELSLKYCDALKP